MKRILNFFKNISKIQYIIFMVIIILIIGIAIPTLSRHKNRINLGELEVWDGTVASSFRKGTGTLENPYVISNGSELAYFSTTLITEDYKDKYVVLGNSIVLNDGLFNYLENDITYEKENITYYLKKYTDDYYGDNTYSSSSIGSINIFYPLDNFKGTFDGNSYTIYGLYMTNVDTDELALFTNLEGKVENLYVENSFIYGGNLTAGIASTTKNAILNNILFDGTVIGDDDIVTNNIETVLEPITYDTVIDETINETINIPYEYTVNDRTNNNQIKGTVIVDSDDYENNVIKINGQLITSSSEFNVSLGTIYKKGINIEIDPKEETKITINLTYTTAYEEATAAGIIGNAVNTNVSNVINKAYVYGKLGSAGLVATLNDSSIINSYNTGNIDGGRSTSGIVNTIIGSTNQVDILNSYNSGTITGSYVGGIVANILSNDNVNIKNSFNASTTDYLIYKVDDSNVTIDNSYKVSGTDTFSGTIVGTFNELTNEDLIDETYMQDNLKFSKFIDLNNLDEDSTAVWVYDSGLPILYIDDILNPIANISINSYTWNNLSYDLQSIMQNSSVTFGISLANNLKPISEIYYYLNSNTKPLDYDEIIAITDWNSYTTPVTLTDEGFYIVYAKVIDTDSNVYYLNSDLIVIDNSGASILIEGNNSNYLEYTEPTIKYINRSTEFNVTASDLISGLATLSYYISGEEISLEDLDDITGWVAYTEPLVLDTVEPQIIYVKATDNVGFTTYANTDAIALNGYTEGNIILGRNTNNLLNNVNITDKSTISFTFSYTDINDFSTNEKHNIITNKLLPVDAILTVIDTNTNEVYKLVVDSSDYGYETNGYATYPLESFSKLNGEYFKESDYQTDIDENFKVILDLSNTSISTNLEDITLQMTILDNDNISRNTLLDTVKTFSIYVDKQATYYLTTDYNGTPINYNSDNTTNVNITTGISYSSVDSVTVYDTTLENKNIGLQVKLVDENNVAVKKSDLKNIILSVNGNEYSANRDGIFKINLEGIDTNTDVLTIATSADNLKLLSGNYYFKIVAFASYDGLNNDGVITDAITIPVNITNNNVLSNNYQFNVIMDEANKIIDKSLASLDIRYSIIEKGNFVNPNVRVSLYVKDTLSGYNQDYTKINLQDYVLNTLTLVGNNTYYAVEDPIRYMGNSSTYNNFDLTFIPGLLDNKAYKLVFDLYDENDLVTTIEKNFIVK